MQGGGLEPKIIEYFYKNREPREYGELSPALRSERNGLKVHEPIAYDEQNQYLRTDGCVGTLTRNCGADLKRNGQGIIEPTKQYSRPHGFNKGGISESEVVPDVRCSSTEDGNNGIVSGIRVRKLTPKECWRLMGFDDESFSRAEKVVSNSQLYKQAGNSIVVDVLMAIFKNLF
jgi:site-specific DNA-cytosine methylase